MGRRACLTTEKHPHARAGRNQQQPSHNQKLRPRQQQESTIRGSYSQLNLINNHSYRRMFSPDTKTQSTSTLNRITNQTEDLRTSASKQIELAIEVQETHEHYVSRLQSPTQCSQEELGPNIANNTSRGQPQSDHKETSNRIQTPNRNSQTGYKHRIVRRHASVSWQIT